MLYFLSLRHARFLSWHAILIFRLELYLPSLLILKLDPIGACDHILLELVVRNLYTGRG